MEDDYNEFQPCFFKNELEEDFYDDPAPSEYIWKKFELLTPPRSPRHEPLSEDDLIPAGGLLDLDRVWDMLNDPVSETKLDLPSIMDPVSDQGTVDNSDAVIQDCMWSGLPSGKIDMKCPPESTTKLFSDKRVSLEINASTECVDPAAVFPYPLSRDVAKTEIQSSLGTETPSDSGRLIYHPINRLIQINIDEIVLN